MANLMRDANSKYKVWVWTSKFAELMDKIGRYLDIICQANEIGDLYDL